MQDVTSRRARALSTRRLTPLDWTICAIACIGFAFDTYELVVMSLIVRPAMIALGGDPVGSAGFNWWVGLLFYVPLAAAGLFGLLGGYLADWFGRRRVLVWSLLIYSVSAAGAAFATSLPSLLIWRCATVSGAAVEFIAAVAWLAELFPEPVQRESVLGYTQAFSGLGSVMLTGAYFIAVTYGDRLPAIHGGHDAWRYTLLFGLAPALPLLIVRPFLPESPIWRWKKTEGTLRRPRVGELFAGGLRKTTLVATALTACSYAAAYGVIQQIPRIVPGLPQVRQLAPRLQEQTVSGVHLFSDLGNIGGRLVFAWLVIRVLREQRLLRSFVAPAVIVFPIVFLSAAQPRASVQILTIGTLIATTLMTAQLSFWGNYLPRMYPTHLRGTGESFVTNIGGRVLGAAAAMLTTSLANAMPGSASVQLAYASACVGTLVYAVAFAGSFALPEPARPQLPD
jgi:MFS family permease